MDVREDLKVGDILPIYSRAFGKSHHRIRCASLSYGVIIAFTKKGYPRTHPIYYKMPQKFDFHPVGKWSRMQRIKQWINSQTIMFNIITLNPEEAENWLDQGLRRKNYNRLMRLMEQFRKKESENSIKYKPNNYFNFD